MKIIFTILFFQLIFITNICISQSINSNIWYFGGYAGLDFNSGVPVALTNGAMNHIEGCATACDSSGTLLFYTDGQKVWNKLHQVMPNGNGLMGHNSATQSSIIVPYPGSANLFFVFTVDAVENFLHNGFRYSIVNMNLDNGKGDLDISKKNILLRDSIPEKVTAILDSYETGYWILTHEWGTDAFLAYHLTPTGLDTIPVISHVGSVHTGGAYPSYPPADGWLNALGYIRANRWGTKIAVVQYRAPLEMFDFNRNFGTVSNGISAPVTYDQSYGIEFSPDETRLYLSTISSALGTTNKLYQFDLTSSTPLTTPVLIATTSYDPSAIQVGPDGKIYVSELNHSYISKINDPNNLGLSCNFVNNGVYLAGKTAKRGLPNLFYYKGFQFITEINNAISAEISVFPNPAKTLLYIKGFLGDEIQVIDINGKKVLEAKNNGKIDISTFTNGLYLIKIRKGNKSYCTKFIKE